MINFTSKTEDIVWLAYKLVKEMGENVSINKFSLYQEILTGKYEVEKSVLGPRYNGIDFNAPVQIIPKSEVYKKYPEYLANNSYNIPSAGR